MSNKKYCQYYFINNFIGEYDISSIKKSFIIQLMIYFHITNDINSAFCYKFIKILFFIGLKFYSNHVLLFRNI